MNSQINPFNTSEEGHTQFRDMNRYLAAFASALVGVIITVPYAVLRFRALPPIAPRAVNEPPRQVTWDEFLFLAECSAVFYAVTYFTGKRIYARFGGQEDLLAVQQFSGTHMRLLHSFVGVFMVAAPWLNPPGAWDLLTICLSVAVGLAMLGSGIWGILGWFRAKLTRNCK